MDTETKKGLLKLLIVTDLAALILIPVTTYICTSQELESYQKLTNVILK